MAVKEFFGTDLFSSGEEIYNWFVLSFIYVLVKKALCFKYDLYI